jgi:hypothetical protein
MPMATIINVLTREVSFIPPSSLTFQTTQACMGNQNELINMKNMTKP